MAEEDTFDNELKNVAKSYSDISDTKGRPGSHRVFTRPKEIDHHSEEDEDEPTLAQSRGVTTAPNVEEGVRNIPSDSVDGSSMIRVDPDDGQNQQADGQSGGINNDGLTVAVAVSDRPVVRDELPSAVEYDEDAKPKIGNRNRNRMLMGLFLLAVVVVAVAVAVGVTVGDSGGGGGGLGSEAPTLSPTLEQSTVRNELLSVLRMEAFEVGSPGERAAQWISDHDPMNLTANDPRLFTRFALATLYYSTNGSDWTVCSEDLTDPNYANCGVHSCGIQTPEEKISSRFLSNASHCDWYGVCCTENEFLEVDLLSNNLTGPIPSEFVKIPRLRKILFAANQISGTIPTEIGDMNHLVNLELNSNYLKGSIPETLYKVVTLQNFNLELNFDLEGTISSKIGDLVELQLLRLNGERNFPNQINGTIPSEIGRLTLLKELGLNDMVLDGSIPSEMSNLNRLELLWLARNQLNGTISEGFGSDMRNLEELFIDGNKISGSLPESFYELTNLYQFNCGNNQMTGTISDSIGNMTKLEWLFMKRNKFSGTIPSILSETGINLNYVQFHFNNFTGNVTNDYCDLFSHSLQRNRGFYADCGPSNALVVCECCTNCCDPVEERCVTV